MYNGICPRGENWMLCLLSIFGVLLLFMGQSITEVKWLVLLRCVQTDSQTANCHGPLVMAHSVHCVVIIKACQLKNSSFIFILQLSDDTKTLWGVHRYCNALYLFALCEVLPSGYIVHCQSFAMEQESTIDASSLGRPVNMCILPIKCDLISLAEPSAVLRCLAGWTPSKDTLFNAVAECSWFTMLPGPVLTRRLMNDL